MPSRKTGPFSMREFLAKVGEPGRRGQVKRKRYSEDQISQILKEAEGGLPVAEVGRRYGVSEQTVYR